MVASAMRHAVAEQPAKAKRIAWIVPAIKAADLRADFAPRFRAFLEELNRLGYVEGRNLVIERYSGEGQTERYAETVRDVVGTHPDLIFATGSRLVVAFKPATTEIPIVTISSDPVFAGLVQSLAHPGGNITGVTIDGGIEFYEKRIQLLKELVPKLSNAFYLVSQPFWEQSIVSGAYREAAKHAGFNPHPVGCDLQ
jgi:putative ABC transport system substrate-binding protein